MLKKWMIGFVVIVVTASLWAMPPRDPWEPPVQAWKVYDGIVKKTVVTTNSNGRAVIETSVLKQVLVVRHYAEHTNAVWFTIQGTNLQQKSCAVGYLRDNVWEKRYGANTNYVQSCKQIWTFNMESTDGVDKAVFIGTETWSEKLIGTVSVIRGAVKRSMSLSGAGISTNGNDYTTATLRYNAKISSSMGSEGGDPDIIRAHLLKLTPQASNAVIILPPPPRWW